MSDTVTGQQPRPDVPEYPANVEVAYPTEPRNRLTTAFRLILVIPIALLIGFLVGPYVQNTGGHSGTWSGSAGTYGWGVFYAGGFVSFATLLMLLFRKKYPRWWYDWNVALLSFSTRISAYFLLLRDEYPSTDEEQGVRVSVRYPDADRELNRFLPIVKWLLAIPHYIVLFFLGIAVLVVVIIGWFAILFTGRLPRGIFDFVVGVMRWQIRVLAYATLLTTDRYPPFRLAP